MGYTGRTMRVRDPQLLRHLRLAANLSQTAIAHRAGVTRGAWSGSYDVTIRKVDDRLWKVYVRARDTDGSSS